MSLSFSAKILLCFGVILVAFWFTVIAFPFFQTTTQNAPSQFSKVIQKHRNCSLNPLENLIGSILQGPLPKPPFEEPDSPWREMNLHSVPIPEEAISSAKLMEITTRLDSIEVFCLTN